MWRAGPGPTRAEGFYGLRRRLREVFRADLGCFRPILLFRRSPPLHKIPANVRLLIGAKSTSGPAPTEASGELPHLDSGEGLSFGRFRCFAL